MKESPTITPEQRGAPPTLDDVLNASRGYGMLNKQGWRNELRRGMMRNGASDAEMQRVADLFTKSDFGLRASAHLARMYARYGSPVEHRFAQEWVDDQPKMDEIFPGETPENTQLKERIRSVLGSEGYDTCAFWTFAPYVYDYLTSKGLSTHDAIAKILSWAKDGVALTTTLGRDEKIDYMSVHLSGLKEEFAGKTTYILDADPKNITHVYTKEKAAEVGALLLK